MFTYNISTKADNRDFKEVCDLIENSKPQLLKEKPLIDVDGTVIQIYLDGGKRIKVVNDYEVDAVYIDSDIELDIILKVF